MILIHFGKMRNINGKLFNIFKTTGILIVMILREC